MILNVFVLKGGFWKMIFLKKQQVIDEIICCFLFLKLKK
jgi:hypothetical protein